MALADASLDWLIQRPIAHRGLHDASGQRPENSIPAALAAADGHFAIECDVQLSRDGTPFVFHDDTLQRLCGEAGEFRGISDAHVRDLRLVGTDWPVPSLAGFLDAIDARVPVVVELKGRSPAEDEGFVAAMLPVIEAYRGPLALMSFDEWLIDQALSLQSRRPVGLTAEGTSDEEIDRHRHVFAKGCRFVSYNVRHLPNAFVAERMADGTPVITWTVRTPEAVEATARFADQMTFEGFMPQA